MISYMSLYALLLLAIFLTSLYTVTSHHIHMSLSSIRQHLSYDDCLEDDRDYYQNCSVLYCVTIMCTIICTLI